MTRSTRTLCLALVSFLLVALCCPPRAQAQPVTPVSHVHSFGGWYLVEVKDTNGIIMGFWGIPRITVEVGNIRRLWFEAVGDDWEVWAFEPIAIAVKMDILVANGACEDSIDVLIYQELLDADTAIDLDIDGGVEGLMINGFIEGDPLIEVAGTLEDPDPLIDLLANIGYPIAPGMTDLMVDGTAGSSMGMNQATKEAIDCMVQGIECVECICSRTGGDIDSTPWVVEADWVDFNTRLKCTYTRTETHTYWRSGIDPDDCLDCTAGTPDDPLINIVEREVITYWYDTTECPPEP